MLIRSLLVLLAAMSVARAQDLPAGVVLPKTMLFAGLSADENATAGNNAAHIVRDGRGRVHLIWIDSGRQGAKTGPVYRRANAPDGGEATWETEPVYVAEDTPGDWNAYPSIAVSDAGFAIVAWQGGETLRVRRLEIGTDGYTWGPVVDTNARSAGRDVGPSVAVRGDTVAIVTPSGDFASSGDGGKTWKTESFAVPEGHRVKTASVAIDAEGGAIVAFSSAAVEPKNEEGSGGYWQLRTIRRSAEGTWSGAEDALAAFPAWGKPTDNEDAIADWVRVVVDSKGGTHLLWHGTAISRKFGHDQSYYSYRPVGGAWREPLPLIPRDDATGIKYSFAPSVAVDGETVIATVFYDVYDGDRWGGFDSDLVVLRGGAKVGAPHPLTHFVRESIASKTPAAAYSARFPGTAPSVHKAADGSMWIDAIETFILMGIENAARPIVYHRVDASALFR